MRFRRFFAFVLMTAAVMCFCAHADQARDEWIQKYNEIAQEIGASQLLPKSLNAYEEEGMFAFLLTERSYLAVYTGLNGSADALIVEIWEDKWDIKAMTAAAIAASDESVSPERAVRLTEEAEAQVTDAAVERYGYYISDGWIITVSHLTVGPSEYKMYSAIRESVYDEIMSEEFFEEETEGADGEEEIPSSGQEEEPEEKTAPKSEKQGDQKIYKI